MGRGSRPGERRGGRAKGAKNAVTRDIRALASKHGPAAIAKLAELMANSEHEQTQAYAAEKLLDRGYGKPAQAITGADGGDVKVIHEIRPALTRDDWLKLYGK